MGFWVVENVTGAVKDYSTDGSIQYDPRFHATRQDIDLPLGDRPNQYVWNGIAIVKKPPEQRSVDLADLKTAIDNYANDVTALPKVKAFMLALKKIL